MSENKKYSIGKGPIKDPPKKVSITIKEGAITAPKIADNAITKDKLSEELQENLSNTSTLLKAL